MTDEAHERTSIAIRHIERVMDELPDHFPEVRAQMTPETWWLFAIVAVCAVFLFVLAEWIIRDIVRDRRIRRRTSYPFTRGDRQ